MLQTGLTAIVVGAALIAHTSSLEDGFDASPAVVDQEIYLRGYKYLYAIAAR